MQTTIYAIINGITADLKKVGFLDKDIEIAVVTAKNIITLS